MEELQQQQEKNERVLDDAQNGLAVKAKKFAEMLLNQLDWAWEWTW